MITKKYNMTQMFSILMQYRSTAYTSITANTRFPETSVRLSREQKRNNSHTTLKINHLSSDTKNEFLRILKISQNSRILTNFKTCSHEFSICAYDMAPFTDIMHFLPRLLKYNKTRNAWQSLAYSPLGAIVSPPSEYL